MSKCHYDTINQTTEPELPWTHAPNQQWQISCTTKPRKKTHLIAGCSRDSDRLEAAKYCPQWIGWEHRKPALTLKNKGIWCKFPQKTNAANKRTQQFGTTKRANLTTACPEVSIPQWRAPCRLHFPRFPPYNCNVRVTISGQSMPIPYWWYSGGFNRKYGPNPSMDFGVDPHRWLDYVGLLPTTRSALYIYHHCCWLMNKHPCMVFQCFSSLPHFRW